METYGNKVYYILCRIAFEVTQDSGRPHINLQ